MTPRVQLVRQNDTHRLIPSKYSANGDSVLVRIADDDDHLEAIFELDNATNDRLLAENNRLPGIGIDELVFGIPYFRIVNAAFCHAHPSGSRFNSPDRGAWYAGFDLETSQAEVAFHKSVELAEVDWLTEEITYDDYLADFSPTFTTFVATPNMSTASIPTAISHHKTLPRHSSKMKPLALSTQAFGTLAGLASHASGPLWSEMFEKPRLISSPGMGLRLR